MNGETEGGTAPGGSRIRRKRIRVDQTKLDCVVALLGAGSESEAIDRLLDAALLRDELIASVERIAGIGGVENYFPGGYAEELEAAR